LIIHAEGDEILPIEEGERLFEACADPDKAFLRVPNAGHNDIQMRAAESYFVAIQTLLARIG
ncbi:MAG: alpha/beta hydrolase, partial [Myxococcota bacterium]|nr:alpha/beta hydrolase [Myxococcota bacterium]